MGLACDLACMSVSCDIQKKRFVKYEGISYVILYFISSISSLFYFIFLNFSYLYIKNHFVIIVTKINYFQKVKFIKLLFLLCSCLFLLNLLLFFEISLQLFSILFSRRHYHQEPPPPFVIFHFNNHPPIVVNKKEEIIQMRKILEIQNTNMNPFL